MVAHILTDNTHSTRQRARHLPGRCRRRCCGRSRAAATREAKYAAPPAFPLTSGPVYNEAIPSSLGLDLSSTHLQRTSSPTFRTLPSATVSESACLLDHQKIFFASVLRPVVLMPCGRACSATALRLPSPCAQPLLLGLLSCAAPSSLCTRGRLHAHVRPGRCLGTYGPRVQTRPCTEWCAPYRAYAPYRRERTRAAQWAARSGTYA